LESQGKPDIRQQVEASRGALKKLQLLIPGLRGYKQKEDIRVSDELLRNQVADRLDRARANLNILRKQMVSNNDLTNLGGLASLISQVQALSGEIRHAAQGYSGFVAPIQVTEDGLNRLYDNDFTFVSTIFQFESSTAPSALAYNPTAPGSIQAAVSQLTAQVRDVREKWATRIEGMEDILLKK
jgi:hypothetical protein